MCRLFLAKYQDLMRYDRQYDALSLMESLEKALGGDGNGIAVVSRQGQVRFMKKGVNYTCTQAWEDLRYYGRADDTVIFHTRLRSAGPVKDEACHPYIYRGLVLAMNGTISEIARFASTLGITDTDLVAQLIAERARTFDEVRAACSTLPAVFVGTFNGRPFMTSNPMGPDLYRWKEGFFYCSKFPAIVPATLASRKRTVFQPVKPYMF